MYIFRCIHIKFLHFAELWHLKQIRNSSPNLSNRKIKWNFYLISLFYLALPWDIWHLEQDVDLTFFPIVLKHWEQDCVQRKIILGVIHSWPLVEQIENWNSMSASIFASFFTILSLKSCCSLMRFMKEIPRTTFTVTYLWILSISLNWMLQGDFSAFHWLKTRRWFLPQ